MKAKNKISKKTVGYTAKGVVYGNLWGGGKGVYVSKQISAPKLSELRKIATEGLDGSLDGGMGYESLIGAVLGVTKTTMVTFNGKKFESHDNSIMYVGNLKKSEKDFCLNCYYNM